MLSFLLQLSSLTILFLFFRQPQFLLLFSLCSSHCLELFINLSLSFLVSCLLRKPLFSFNSSPLKLLTGESFCFDSRIILGLYSLLFLCFSRLSLLHFF